MSAELADIQSGRTGGDMDKILSIAIPIPTPTPMEEQKNANKSFPLTAD
ncbi:MAG: hypothetical protein JW808_01745 [Victivallales bacterium]|nr:hypothetical protein [Victivallales bacterium]